MAHETLIKRVIYVSQCPKCGSKDIKESNPPKERFCTECGEWVPYKEESYTGPEIGPT